MTPSPGIPPPRRRYEQPPTQPAAPGATDSQRLILHVGPAAFGFGIGLIWLIWTGGVLPIYTPVLTAVGVWAITQLITKLGAAIAARYMGLTGDTTPQRREYSQPRALTAQGRYDEAAAAWEIAAAEAGGDPEPYLQLARLLRDHLDRPEDAAAWFRRTRRDATLPPGQDLLVSQELIELYRTALNQPRRAIPELARIRERFPNTPMAEAAERELAALRKTATQEDGNPEPERE